MDRVIGFALQRAHDSAVAGGALEPQDVRDDEIARGPRLWTRRSRRRGGHVNVDVMVVLRHQVPVVNLPTHLETVKPGGQSWWLTGSAGVRSRGLGWAWTS